MGYSKVRLKGFVERDVCIFAGSAEMMLKFYISPDFGPIHYALEPLCCVAAGDEAKAAFNAALDGDRVVVEGSFLTRSFRDDARGKYYDMSCIRVTDVTPVKPEEDEKLIRQFEAKGRLDNLRSVRDQDGDTYYACGFLEVMPHYGQILFPCNISTKLAKEFKQAYEKNPYDEFELKGIVTNHWGRTRKGRVDMWVHEFSLPGREGICGRVTPV